jgi:hypothetical protein
MVNKMTNKRDTVIEARLDSRDLATCARYLTDKNCPINSISELVHLSLQMAVYAIGHNEFETTQEARDYLQSIGLANLNHGNRGRNKLTRILQEETLSADGFSPNYGQARTTKADITPTEIDAIIDKMDAVDVKDSLQATISQVAQSKNILVDKKE